MSLNLVPSNFASKLRLGVFTSRTEAAVPSVAESLSDLAASFGLTLELNVVKFGLRDFVRKVVQNSS